MINRFLSEDSQPANDADVTTRNRNAFLVSVVVFVIYASVTAIYGFFLTKNGAPQLVAVTIIAALQTAISGYAIWLCRTGKSAVGVIYLSGGLLINVPLVPLFISGVGIALGIGVLVGVYLITSITISPDRVNNFTLPIIGSAILTIVIELFNPFKRETIPFLSVSIPIFVAVGIGIFLIYFLRGFANYPLRAKLIFSFVLVTILPLGIFSLIENAITRNILTTQTNSDLIELSKLTAQSVDSFVSTQLDILRTEAQHPALRDYLGLNPILREGSFREDTAKSILVIFARKDPVFIHSYAILDKEGVNLIDTFSEHQGRSENTYPYYRQPLANGLPYASGAIFTEDGETNMYISAPIRNETGQILGVLRAEYNIGILQNMVKKLLPENHQNQLIALVDNNTYIRIAYTGDRDERFLSYGSFTDLEIIAFQIEGKMIAGDPKTIMESVPTTIDGLNNLQNEPNFSTYSDSLGGSAIAAATTLETQPWYALALQTEESAFAPVEAQRRTLFFIVMLMTSLSVGAALLVTNILVRPVTTLTDVARKLSSGDMSAKADINTADEYGTLASTINQMSAELSQTLSGLEERVAERTVELELSNIQSEERAQQLTAISDVSRTVASEQRLDRLLPLISRLVSEKFGYYHVGIFLLDDTRTFAVLQASNSDGGQRMLARGHRLGVGQVGIVGYVSKTGNPRIALDVGADATFFDNPDLPNTHSEMALPLKVRGEIIGIIDIQSEQAEAFTESDINTLSILADQIAIAIDNARLFGDSQRALSEVQSLYAQFTSQEWSQVAQQITQLGYVQTLTGGQPLDAFVESSEAQLAMQRGEAVVVTPSNEEQDPMIAMPVKLRDQVIGVMQIKSPAKGHVWSVDEINMVQAVSDRLALALDNARLFNETQKRAATERAIGDVSSKLSASSDIDDILRLTVEELGKLLQNSEIAIQLGDGSKK